MTQHFIFKDVAKRSLSHVQAPNASIKGLLEVASVGSWQVSPNRSGFSVNIPENHRTLDRFTEISWNQEFFFHQKQSFESQTLVREWGGTGSGLQGVWLWLLWLDFHGFPCFLSGIGFQNSSRCISCDASIWFGYLVTICYHSPCRGMGPVSLVFHQAQQWGAALWVLEDPSMKSAERLQDPAWHQGHLSQLVMNSNLIQRNIHTISHYI